MTLIRSPHCECGLPVERPGALCLACAMETVIEWCVNCENRPPLPDSRQCAVCEEQDRLDRWAD